MPDKDQLTGLHKAPIPRIDLAGLARSQGPLGHRHRNPATMDKLQKAVEVLSAAQGARAQEPVELVAGQEDDTEGDEHQEVGDRLMTPLPVTPAESPEEAVATTENPAMPKEQIPEETFEDKIDNPLNIIARAGMAWNIRAVQNDPEFVKSMLSMATPERRVFFEKHRCEEIDWDAVFSGYEITQRVTLWTKPKKLVVVFRASSGAEEAIAREVIKKHYSSTAAMMEVGLIIIPVVLGLHSINDEVLPSIPLDDNKARDEVVGRRLQRVLRMPFIMIQDMAINYAWFTMRIRDALARGEVGNG